MAQVALLVAGAAQAVGAYQKSKYHDAQAAEYRKAKNRTMAATTREMAEARRQKERIESRALVLAAASGAGTAHGAVDLFADLAAEGQYRIMSLLWRGQNDAQGLEAQARAQEKASDDSLISGLMSSVTTIFSGYSGGFKPVTSSVPASTASSLGGSYFDPSRMNI